MRRAAFAIPGDINTLTGGYIYERRLLLGLRDLGMAVEHIELAASFPDPTLEDMADAVARLAALPPEQALILDGLVFGSIEGLSAISAPIAAMIHHPLALETGLSEARRAHLYQTERANLALARHVLVPSRHTAEILETQYAVPPQDITIAPPGTDRPSGARRRADPPLVLSVGLQHPRKGHDVLLKALARLTDLPWTCTIVGRAHDAEHAAELAAMREALGLAGRVTLAGTLSRADLDALYSRASVFALATRYEGYGIVFDEALSWGLPIVSCRTGAVPDTVPPEAGLLTPVDDPEATAEALRQVLTNSTLRANLSEAANRAGQALPSWADTARIAARVVERLE